MVVGALSVTGYLSVRGLWQRQPRLVSADAAREVAMRVVLALDDLVGACYIAATDSPEIDVDEPKQFFFHSDDPVLHLPKDVDWTLLGQGLGDDVRWIPNRLRNLVEALESVEIDPPNYKNLFERRQEGFARIGLSAADLIERIAEQFKISMPERPDYYDPRQGFILKIQEVEEFWKRRTDSVRQLPDGKSNVTPLFGRWAPDNSTA
jgi:hypothetical protein